MCHSDRDEFPLQGEQGDIEQAERHYEHPVYDPSDLPVRPRASRDSTPDSEYVISDTILMHIHLSQSPMQYQLA